MGKTTLQSTNKNEGANAVPKVQEFVKPKTTYSDTLRFSPYAWAKLLFMQSSGPTEVAGFCITGTDDPLLVTDFKLIKQYCTAASFDFDEGSLADYQELMTDAGVELWKCCRILAHTHPCGPSPSEIDEKNFRKVFSSPDWAIMFIVGDNGEVYCRLKINVAPGVEKLLKVRVDFVVPFYESNHDAWKKEYADNVFAPPKLCVTGKENIMDSSCYGPLWWDDHEDSWKHLSQIEEEAEDFDCFWDDSGMVAYWDEGDAIWYGYDPDNFQWYMEDENYGQSQMKPISRPNEPWAIKVVSWAKKFAHERKLAIREEQNANI